MNERTNQPKTFEAVAESLADEISAYFTVDWGTNDIDGTEKFVVDTPKIAAILQRSLTDAAQAEVAELREPMECGHPRVCWVPIPKPNLSADPDIREAHCTVCAALRAKDEEIARLREALGFVIDANDSDSAMYQIEAMNSARQALALTAPAEKEKP